MHRILRWATLGDAVLLMGARLRWLRRWVTTSLSAPLMLMYFLLMLTNTLLRDTKDTLLVTSEAGVEAIPQLKSWVVASSVLYFVVYFKLSSWLDERQLFICVLASFNLFYVFFAWVLYPAHLAVVPRDASHWLEEVLPSNARPMRLLLENWPLGLYYVVSELYASAVCQFLFWKVSNELVSVDRAKSIYPLIGVTGNLGMIYAGHMLRDFANERDIVAAHAYLRAKMSKSNKLKAKYQFGEDSVGYSAISDWMLPFTQDDMDPLDQAWQGTLLGISLLMMVCSAIIVVSYDAVHNRSRMTGSGSGSGSGSEAGSEAGSDAGMGAEIPHPHAQSAHSSLHHLHELPSLKRRTGSHDVNLNGNDGVGGSSSNNSDSNDDDAAGELVGLVSASASASTFSPASASRSESESESVEAAKPTLSLLDALRALSMSTPLRCAATLVVSYGVSISLVEVSWKGQVKKALAKPNDYARVMGSCWEATGILSMVFMLVGRSVLQRAGYGPAMLFTPIGMLVTGALFFLVSIAQDMVIVDADVDVDGAAASVGAPWAAYIGGAAVLFAKAAKYAFFDATKEIIFIPLDAESKNLGKAAIDVVAYRLAKSGGSVVLQVVMFIFGSISTSVACIPIAAVFVVVVVAWVRAALIAITFLKDEEQHVLPMMTPTPTTTTTDDCNGDIELAALVGPTNLAV